MGERQTYTSPAFTHVCETEVLYINNLHETTFIYNLLSYNAEYVSAHALSSEVNAFLKFVPNKLVKQTFLVQPSSEPLHFALVLPKFFKKTSSSKVVEIFQPEIRFTMAMKFS